MDNSELYNYFLVGERTIYNLNVQNNTSLNKNLQVQASTNI